MRRAQELSAAPPHREMALHIGKPIFGEKIKLLGKSIGCPAVKALTFLFYCNMVAPLLPKPCISLCIGMNFSHIFIETSVFYGCFCFVFFVFGFWFSFFVTIFSTFQLLNSSRGHTGVVPSPSPPPPRLLPSLFYCASLGFSNPTARRFFIECC